MTGVRAVCLHWLLPAVVWTVSLSHAFLLPFVPNPSLADDVCVFFADKQVGIVRVDLDGSNPTVPIPAFPRPHYLHHHSVDDSVWWLDARGSIRTSPASPSVGSALSPTTSFGSQTVVVRMSSASTPPTGFAVQSSAGALWWIEDSVNVASMSGVVTPTPIVASPTLSGKIHRGLGIDTVANLLYFTSQDSVGLGGPSSLLSIDISSGVSTTPSPTVTTVVSDLTTVSEADTVIALGLDVSGPPSAAATHVYVLSDERWYPKLHRVRLSDGFTEMFDSTEVVDSPHDCAVFGNKVYIASGTLEGVTGFVSKAQLWAFDATTTSITKLSEEAWPTSRAGVTLDVSGALWWSDGRSIRTASPSTGATLSTVVSQDDDLAVPPTSLSVTPDGLLAWGATSKLGTADPEVPYALQTGWTMSRLDKVALVRTDPVNATAADALTFHPNNRQCAAFTADATTGSLRSTYFCEDDPAPNATVSDVVQPGFVAKTGVDVDVDAAQLYFTDGLRYITRSTFNGSDTEEVVSTTRPRGIVLDHHRNMYWTELLAVKRATVDGDSVTDLATGILGGRGIAIDTVRQLLAFTETSGKVSVMNMDGSARRVVDTGLDVDGVVMTYCTTLPTPSQTASPSASSSHTPTTSASASVTATPSRSATHSATSSEINSKTPTPSRSSSASTSPSHTSSASLSPSHSPSHTPSATHTPSVTPSSSTIYQPQTITLRLIGLDFGFVSSMTGAVPTQTGLAQDLATFTNEEPQDFTVMTDTITFDRGLLIDVLVNAPGDGATSRIISYIHDADAGTRVMTFTNLATALAQAGRAISDPAGVQLFLPLPPEEEDNSLKPWQISVMVLGAIALTVICFMVWYYKIRKVAPLTPKEIAEKDTNAFVSRVNRIYQTEVIHDGTYV